MDWLTAYLPNGEGVLEEMTNEVSIQQINWGYASAYSPKVRAELIYDAIFNKKINYIYITGGRGNEDTINELEKLIRARNPEPLKFDEMPIVYGMSDATNMLNYLGQRNIARSFVAGNGISSIFRRQRNGQELFVDERDLRQEVKRCDSKKDRIDGILIPEYLLRSYGTLQEMRLFKDRVNFLATEIHFPGEAELMKGVYGAIKPEDRKNIVFCLSAVGESDESITPEQYERKHKRRLGKTEEEKEKQLKIIIKSNQHKAKEQNEFKKWCLENGFRIIEDIKFGHENNPDQYLPIPGYCECELDGNELQYSFRNPTFDRREMGEVFVMVNIPKYELAECHKLTFGENYAPGGVSEVSTFIENADSVEKTQKAMPIFIVKNLGPDENGKFGIEFDGFNGRKCSPSVYIQDLERALRDVRSLEMRGLKSIEIIGFDLPLEEKFQSSERRNGEVIKNIIGFISKEYLKNVTIKIGNELEFKNGIVIQRGNQVGHVL